MCFLNNSRIWQLKENSILNCKMFNFRIHWLPSHFIWSGAQLYEEIIHMWFWFISSRTTIWQFKQLHCETSQTYQWRRLSECSHRNRGIHLWAHSSAAPMSPCSGPADGATQGILGSWQPAGADLSCVEWRPPTRDSASTITIINIMSITSITTPVSISQWDILFSKTLIY